LEGIAPWIAGKKKRKKKHLGSNTWWTCGKFR
jgi:hypothetical protein